MHDIPTRGIFPPVDVDAEDCDSLRFEDPSETTNYTSVDDAAGDSPAWTLIRGKVAAGFAIWLSPDEARQRWTSLQINPLADLEQTKVDPEGKLVVKHRLVHDLRKPGTNKCQRVPERVVYPRVGDTLNDYQALLPAVQPGESLEDVPIDVADAFTNIPSKEDERGFTAAAARPPRDAPDEPGAPPPILLAVLVFLSLVFGAKGSPLVWGRFAAFLGRAGQALFPGDRLRLQVYVDDPKLTVRGDQKQRDRVVATVLWFWTALGTPLAWHKGQRGQPGPGRPSDVVWIGARFQIHPDRAEASVPDGTAQARGRDVAALLAGNKMRSRALRRFAGWGSWAAGFTPALRPFIRLLWGALQKKGPDGMVWRKQADRPLQWCRALLCGGDLVLNRTVYPFDPGARCPRLVVDASPWGLGGVCLEPTPHGGSRPVAFFAIDIPGAALRRYSARVGDSSWQDLWEMLALLVAAREWARRFVEREVHLASDSLVAIGAALKMSSPSAELNDVGAELALAMAGRHFRIAVVDHIPGVDNTLADALSRLSRGARMPAELRGVPRVTPAPLTWRAFPERLFR